MKRLLIAVVALVAMTAFTSCNQQKSAAKKLVEQFLTDNLASDDYKVMYFYDLDTPKHISDSAFLQMRQKATTNKRYKDGLQFADGQKTKKLNFIRVKMLIQKDTVYQTFYFDDQITQVMAFKED